MRITQWLILLVVYGVSCVRSRQPSAEPQDITSINSLSVANNGIDPKLRKALLRVLNKIKEEENGQLPADLPEEDFLKVIGEPAQTEDLGSYEFSEEAKGINFPHQEAIQFGQKLLGQKQPSTRQETSAADENLNTDQGSSDFNGYYINPPSGQNNEFSQGESLNENRPTGDGSYHYEPPSSAGLPEEETDSEKDVNNTANTEKETEESQTQPNAEEKVTQLIETTQASNVQSEVSSTIESLNTEQTNENSPSENGLNQQKSSESPKPTDDDVPNQELPTGTDQILTTAQRETPEIITEQATSEGAEGRSLENDVQEKGAESKVVSLLNNFSSRYSSFVPRTGSNFLPTKPTPDEEQSFQGPTPIDIPYIEDEQEVENATPKREVDLKSTKTTGNEGFKSNVKEGKKKNEKVRHIVEFVSAPLITAFTVEQDDKGVPHKIIPLDYVHPTQPPAPTEDPELVAQRQRELEEKEFILQQQLRTLQQEKYRYTGVPQPSPEQLFQLQRQENLRKQQFVPQQQQQFLPQQQSLLPQVTEIQRQEELRRQQEFLNYQQNVQRQQELQRQQEFQRQQDVFRQEQLRQQQLGRHTFQLPNQFIPSSQGIDFQKSVDFRLPLFEHNRVHRNEPNRFVSNFGYNRPMTIHGQIQSLISESGISTGLPRNTQADLSIVSKILALNHGTFGPQNHVSNNVKRHSPKVFRNPY